MTGIGAWGIRRGSRGRRVDGGVRRGDGGNGGGSRADGVVGAGADGIGDAEGREGEENE